MSLRSCGVFCGWPPGHGTRLVIVTFMPRSLPRWTILRRSAAALCDAPPLVDVVGAALDDQDLRALGALVEALGDLVRALSRDAAVADGHVAQLALGPVLVLALLVRARAQRLARRGVRVPQRRAGGDRVADGGDARASAASRGALVGAPAPGQQGQDEERDQSAHAATVTSRASARPPSPAPSAASSSAARAACRTASRSSSPTASGPTPSSTPPSGRVAARLLALGLEPGDRVAAFGKNSDAYLLLYLGCARAGLVHVPVNFNATGDELAYLLDAVRAARGVRRRRAGRARRRALDLGELRAAATLRRRRRPGLGGRRRRRGARGGRRRRRRPRAAALHVGHHLRAQGRDAHPPGAACTSTSRASSRWTSPSTTCRCTRCRSTTRRRCTCS